MIAILTGPIQTGKTTALLSAFPPGDARGIAQPAVDGKRRVLDLRTRESHLLEPDANTSRADRVHVGRFAFSSATLRWANACVAKSLDDVLGYGWIVVDEVGPLELGGGGLSPSVRDAVGRAQSPSGPRVLLVVREGLVQAVSDTFGIIAPLVIRLGSRLPGGPQIG